MPYKCRICGINAVEHPGEVCRPCEVGQGPHAEPANRNNSSRPHISVNGPSQDNGYVPKHKPGRRVLLGGGASLSNSDPYGNDMTGSSTDSSEPAYSAGQAPQGGTGASAPKPVAVNQPISVGIVKNMILDRPRKSFLSKWVRTMFTGIPFALDNDVTAFQVFPDLTGTALNAIGNACDQVIVYGRLAKGAISENNDVEVFGRRDAKNNIIAKKIRNKASGTVIQPARTAGVGAVWIITVLALCLFAAAFVASRVQAVLWAAIVLLWLTRIPKALKIIGTIFGVILAAIILLISSLI